MIEREPRRDPWRAYDEAGASQRVRPKKQAARDRLRQRYPGLRDELSSKTGGLDLMIGWRYADRRSRCPAPCLV